ESAVTRDQAQQLWASLNDVAHTANATLHSEAEGAALGTDHAVAATNDYIETVYSSREPLVVRSPDDPALMPTSWGARSGESSVLVAAKQATWVNVASRYCMGCHRTNG